ncbi:UNVERIFIED_CONTAM: hypothetical protein HDU68_000808 [Siphonaria sp. JEL0065]|nr:hypothetical protein HDU68_000808 [Siphonaria sp. JEL0065]
MNVFLSEIVLVEVDQVRSCPWRKPMDVTTFLFAKMNITNEEILRAEWSNTQNELKKQLITTNNLSFNQETLEGLKYIAGVDVSFYDKPPASNSQANDNGDDADASVVSTFSETAIVCLAVLNFPSLTLAHQIVKSVHLPLPYIPGFLAMRECPAILEVLADLKTQFPAASPPQILFIDGNGVFHPRGFGVACQVGVLTGVPTIGIAKNLLEIRDDGVKMKSVKALSADHLTGGKTFVNIVGESGVVYGAAVRATEGAKNPVFVSNGHCIDLETAVKLTLAVSKHRQPEPIRFADHLGREFIRVEGRK